MKRNYIFPDIRQNDCNVAANDMESRFGTPLKKYKNLLLKKKFIELYHELPNHLKLFLRIPAFYDCISKTHLFHEYDGWDIGCRLDDLILKSICNFFIATPNVYDYHICFSFTFWFCVCVFLIYSILNYLQLK